MLTFYYRPTGNAFQNVEEITSLVPYGRFFRQVHYSSGQFFVILMLVHTVDHFLKKRYLQYRTREWVSLVASLGLCFFTLFTGFVLKGDKEGIFAGQILIHILKTLPLAGEDLARIFIEPGDHFFFLPFLYHSFFFPATILFLIRRHIREWLPDEKYLTVTAIGIFAYALLIPPFLDIPPEARVDLVKGPWFFLGLQTLLKYLPALWAGLVIPGAFLGLLLGLPTLPVRTAKAAHYFILALGAFYAALCLRALVFAP